jgi:hypothetical protein
MNNKNNIFPEYHNILSNIFMIFADGIFLFEEIVFFCKVNLLKKSISQLD